MIVLGWHGNPRLSERADTDSLAYHDAAAAILRDGMLLAAIEQERLDRVKHSSYFPARAIRFCLEEAGATLHDVDAIVADMDEQFCNYVALREASVNPAVPLQTGRSMVAAAFQREFNIDVSEKIHFCKHHLAHLHSAWQPSGFSDALVVTIDGNGDGASGLIASCEGDQIRILRHIPESLSLGNFYLHHLYFLGYGRFDEYKAMGLAPYGDASVYESLFEQMYELQPEGRFTLRSLRDCLLIGNRMGLGEKARRKGEPFTQAHKDFAAGLQVNLERIVEHMILYFQKITGARRLCLSGGVAHNCSMNGKLLRSGRFDEIYVQPAAHDAGNAIGAALAFAHDIAEPVRRDIMRHLFLGPHVGTPEQIGVRLESWGQFITFERRSDIARLAAEQLASGRVIGWVQDRSEFGPRALGNRSILADPRPAENKHIVNAMVKKREAFRPFAPAVLEERLHDYFALPPSTRAVPYMVIVAPVHPHARELLAAVTHVDGTARVQSVSRMDNPRFHALIACFEQLTGVPVILNTSFNNHAEPIVDSIDDAVTAFLTTGLHALAIGDWWVTKSEPQSIIDGVLDLSAVIPPHRKLVRRTTQDGAAEFCIESTSAAPPITVSRDLFRALVDPESASIRRKCCEHGPANEQKLAELARELFELWTARAIQLRPVSSA